MVRSVDPRGETLRAIQWPVVAASLFGTRRAETIMASGPQAPHTQAGHMDASDPIKNHPRQPLQAGGRPHMDCFAFGSQ